VFGTEAIRQLDSGNFIFHQNLAINSNWQLRTASWLETQQIRFGRKTNAMAKFRDFGRKMKFTILNEILDEIDDLDRRKW